MDRVTPTPLPPVFLSHGSPMIALEPGDAGAFMARLGPAIDAVFGRPAAILALSAHTLAKRPVLLAAARHEAVHDFGNFDPRLFTLRYGAAGAPELADQVATRLAAAGLDPLVLPNGGLDHGIWTALRHAVPDAGLPVLPLAWNPAWSPASLWALGEALAPLAGQRVWVLATGSITHNLRRVFSAGGLLPSTGQPEAPDSARFRSWWAGAAAERNWPALLDYRRQAPHAIEMHPTDEHLLPWFAAAGAGGADHAAVRLHAGVTHGCLGMDAYAFGPSAAALAQHLAQHLAERPAPDLRAGS
jgi:4,5-DOPA dioxygenase extradiol